MSRILRTVVCLLLICCILVNLSPLRAKATGLETAAAIGVAGISAPVAIGGIIIALGVWAAAEAGIFDSVVDACTTAMAEAGYVIDGYVQGLVANGKSYFYDGLVDSVRDWLYDSGTLIDNTVALPSAPPTGLLDAYSVAAEYPYAVLLQCLDAADTYWYGTWYVAYSTTPFDYVGNHVDDQAQGLGCFRSWNSKVNYWSDTQYLYAGEDDVIQYFGTGVSAIATELDLTLGNVITKDQDIQDIIVTVEPLYIDLTEIAPELPSPDDPEKSSKHYFWPVTTPGTYEETFLMNQEQAQIGDTQYEDDSHSGSGSDSGSDTGSGSGSDSGSDTGSGSGSGSWSPPSDYTQFTLADLKNYFPFCIPFDLYDFFTCLNADPVAPVIDWIIPMPGGDSYPLQLDLSTFDSVAQLLRRLQLLAFCIGLAFKTRDLIKG